MGGAASFCYVVNGFSVMKDVAVFFGYVLVFHDAEFGTGTTIELFPFLQLPIQFRFQNPSVHFEMDVKHGTQAGTCEPDFHRIRAFVRTRLPEGIHHIVYLDELLYFIAVVCHSSTLWCKVT